jgi:glucose/arabinose dehydrogenase
MKRYLILLLLLVVWITLIPPSAVLANDWKNDWVIQNGFTIDVDTEGYDLPSAIAFVPNPGPDPKDALYFVTELRGKVKVVTNDRSVYTFADNFFQLVPNEELPNIYGELGLAGIALDPAHGYVFVSFSYQDNAKILHNSIVRFSSKEGVFGLKATAALSFQDIFKADTTNVAHFIGGMVVDGSALFVSVGDGFQPMRAQDIGTTSGKILRMTLDGKPLRDNPYYENDDITSTRNFVWAIGFRNPFSLSNANGRLFTADNGLDIDRFLEVQRGENYHWDGTDLSIGMNAPMVFAPAVSPVQLTWLNNNGSVFPSEYRSKFYLALAGNRSDMRGVAILNYDFSRSRMASRPTNFLLYTGSNPNQMPVGVAFGRDGLYVVPIHPVKDGPNAKGAVLRIRYLPASTRNTPTGFEPAQAIMVRASCVHCHGYDETDTTRPGPSLDGDTLIPRILKRLETIEYQERLRSIDSLNIEPYASYRAARQQVMGAKDTERARLWIKYRLIDPRFDQLTSAMPVLGLSEAEAETIAEYLVSRHEKSTVEALSKRILRRLIPQELRRKHIVIAFIAGIVSAYGAYLVLLIFRKLR